MYNFHFYVVNINWLVVLCNSTKHDYDFLVSDVNFNLISRVYFFFAKETSIIWESIPQIQLAQLLWIMLTY
jgi:hypothetical protein